MADNKHFYGSEEKMQLLVYGMQQENLTLLKFWWYNKVYLGELVLLEFLGNH